MFSLLLCAPGWKSDPLLCQGCFWNVCRRQNSCDGYLLLTWVGALGFLFCSLLVPVQTCLDGSTSVLRCVAPACKLCGCSQGRVLPQRNPWSELRTLFCRQGTKMSPDFSTAQSTELRSAGKAVACSVAFTTRPSFLLSCFLGSP